MRLPALALCGLLLAGCLSGPEAAPSPTPASAPGVPSTPAAATPTPAPPTGQTLAPLDIDPRHPVVEANTRFAFDLLRELAREEEGANLFFSPFSVSTALAMVYAGAEGETRRAMAEALGFDAVDGETMAGLYRQLLANLSAQENVTLDIASAAWIDQRIAGQMREAYLDEVRQDLMGEVATRDFADPATVDEVNAWVAARTQEKIPKVLEGLSPDEVMVLVNAIYFDGGWQAKFEPGCTRAAPFRLADGGEVEVQMMCRENATAASFTIDENGTTLRLPYEGDRFAMYVHLPPENASLADAIGRFDAETFRARVAGLSPGAAFVELPRLSLTTRYQLNDALNAMGMGIAFSDSADFGRMAEAPLAISRVSHDAVIEVDENGTVAAAATTVVMVLTCDCPPPEPPRIVVDRPFLVAIRDDASGALLFLGAVHDPTAA